MRRIVRRFDPSSTARGGCHFRAQVARTGTCKDDPLRATVMFEGPEDVLYNIFTNPETKPIVEASGHVYKGAVITRWLA